MASRGSLFEMCLKEAQLGHYSSSFQGRGIGDLETLATLSMQEYNSYGVTVPEDKKQLFRLIHTLRNLDLNKLSNLNGADQQQLASNEISTSNSMSNREKTSHHGNKKAIKNHHNSMAAQSGRTSEMVQLDERLNNSHHHITKLGDMPKNSGLNRTFDKDDESDKEGSDGSVTLETVYTEADRNLNNGVNDSRVQVLEHSNSGYNYGVPSASPTTQHKLKSGLKSATVSSPHSRNGAKLDEKIKVCVRKRPMNQKEWRAGEGDAVSVEGTTTALVKERKLAVDLTKLIQVHKYHFDEVFHETCSNEEVYERTAKPLLHTIFNRGKATCFAYGQTGAGKTHTLLGGQGGKVKGLYLLAAEDIFTVIRSSAEGHGLLVYVSYFEIYCGQLFDLLNSRERLHARENAHHKVCISGLNEIRVNGPQALIQVVETGNRLRVVGVSGVNADSSRSHAILQIQLKDKAGNHIGKFSFIDLAGSERACDMSDPDKITRQEGAEINTSLLALKECIRALDQEKRHTPFRQSKLTQVLRDSFLGQSRTCMIACVAPNASAVDHTLNTLRYADRVKELRQEGGLGNSPAADSSINIATKHPPTPSNFSPGSTSTPQKTKRSKQDTPSSASRGSPKKKGDLSQRRNTLTSSGKSSRSRMEARRKSAPDTSPTKSPAGAASSGKFAGKKSASHHNLQKSGELNGQSRAEKRNRGEVEVVQKLKYEQVSNASGSKSVEKRKVIQSGVKVRENRTLEERKMRASANRSKYEDMNLSLGNETPSKRTPEVRARMKKAFLNSSLPVWDLNHQESEVPSPSKPTPPPQMLEFDNPRYVESPSKEQPKIEDQRTWSQRVADEGKVNIPYRFDVPNPRYSQQQASVDDIESGYLPDMDTEIETPRSNVGDQTRGDVTNISQEQDLNFEKRSSFEDSTEHNRQNETAASIQLEEVQEVRVSSKSEAYSKENCKRTRTPSSESRPSSRSDSSSTVELLAEIERSLQRSPVPVTPKPGSEPWMRVISEDHFHGSGVSPSNSPRSPRAEGSSKGARKELFGGQKQGYDTRGLHTDHVADEGEESHARYGDLERFGEESPMKRKVKQTQDVRLSGVGDVSIRSSMANSPDKQRSSHVLKEKLHHSGFSQRELLGGGVSPQIVQETQSENLQMHDRSQSEKTDFRVQSQQNGQPQARSAWVEGSVGGSTPVVQPGKGASSQEHFFSAQSHIPVSPYDSQSTNYATPTDSRLGQQRTAVSSTPKAFKHESLGMDTSLLHLSFSAIQSPAKGSNHPSSETNESFTTAYEATVKQKNTESACEGVVLPVSPRLTLTKSKSDGNLMKISPNMKGHHGESAGTSPGLKPPQRPAYQRQNSAAERASTSNLSSHSTAHPNNHNSTRDLLLTAHAEQLEETLRLCETGWSLIAQLRSNQMDVQSYMSQAGDLLDSHVWCLDTFRDQLNSFSRCSTPNK